LLGIVNRKTSAKQYKCLVLSVEKYDQSDAVTTFKWKKKKKKF